MKRIGAAVLLAALITAVFIACQNGTGLPADTDALGPESAAVSESAAAAETEGPTFTDEDLHGWFAYGSEGVLRDDFTVVTRDTFALTMAQNEKEGFQFILASAVDYPGLTCRVSEATDGKGHSLTGTVYIARNVFVNKADYYHPRGFTPDPLLEQDNPYWGGTFDVIAGRSKTLYVQFVTDPDTVPGTYEGTLEILSGDRTLISHPFTVRVWNICYSDETECIALFQYGYHAGDPGAVAPGPDSAPDMDPSAVGAELAYARQQQYADFLLDNRLSPSHLPFPNELLEEDSALVAKYMDNPRLTMTLLGNYDTLRNQSAVASANGWTDKIAIYIGDEPAKPEDLPLVRQLGIGRGKAFGTTRMLCAYTPISELDRADPNVAIQFSEYTTLQCPNTLYFTGHEDIIDTLMRLRSERGDTILWYVAFTESFDTVNYLTCSPGTDKRILEWQQYQNDVDGIYYFQTTRWNRYPDIWAEDYEETKPKFPRSDDITEGDGVLIYWDPLTQAPVGSLALEAVRDGIEDFQLLRMAEKVLGKDAVMAQVERITTAINRYTSDPELLYQVRNDVAEMLENAAK